MKRILVAISITLAIASLAIGQQADTRAGSSARNDTSVSKQGRQFNLQSETLLSGQLESALDARHAKVGDRVVVKTTQAVKHNGEVIVPKGTRLVGHITEVQQRTKSTGESRLGIVFDRLQNGSMTSPITATIVSIIQARSTARSDNAAMDSEIMSSSNASSSRSTGSGQRNGGGLLGGVTNTVGGVANTTAATVGNVAGGTTSAVGSTVGATNTTVANTTGSLQGLQITQTSSTSAEGGSTLSLSGGNVRLESGTTFNVSVSNSASAGKPQ